jgi:N,N-dimethylformamidase
MAFKFVFGDDEGVVYGVTTAGDLLWYRHLSGTGTANWANGGSAQQIGTGWSQFTQILTGGDGVIYAVEPTGGLLWYQHLSRTGDVQWANAGTGVQIGSGWNGFTRVFSGGGGVIYGIDSAGDLWWYEHLSNQGVPNWANAGAGQKVGAGWGHFINVFSGGNGVIYAIEPGGNLLWYRHLSRDGGAVWANEGVGQQIGTGWDRFSHVFSSGDGVIYAVAGSGDLLWYEHLSREGEAEWANGGTGQVIGTGWEMPVIEGYCSPLSVAPGEKIDFRMSTGADAFTVTYMRLKQQADGSLGIPTSNPFLVQGRLKDTPNAAYETDCGWETDFSLVVPANWSSGLYVAKCEDTDGFIFYVVFIVRPSPANRRDFAVLANTNTWTAYNAWGGRSQYTTPNAAILTLERPNPDTSPIDDPSINHLTRAELWVLAWLKDSGYSFDVYSDLDFHQGIAGLADYKALILHTHPEYWSFEMMDRLQTFLNQGGKLLYLGGNGIYERVQFDAALKKMILRDGNPNNARWLFREQVPPRPERAVLAVAYEGDNWSGNTADYAPYAVRMENHRFFQGTGVHNGDLMGQNGRNGAASGWEMDTSKQLPGHDPGAPPADVQVLAEGTNVGPTNDYSAQMTYYDTGAGGFVFSVGSLTFGGSLVVDASLQRIVRNVLDECLA